jgi:hypothetical protein
LERVRGVDQEQADRGAAGWAIGGCVDHCLVFPLTARPRHALRVFARWLADELKLDFSEAL